MAKRERAMRSFGRARTVAENFEKSWEVKDEKITQLKKERGLQG